ncbi:MAG: sugar transferase [Bacteroidetes bacterium]|nr:sugar transferase [Bacteroidota bacterium]
MLFTCLFFVFFSGNSIFSIPIFLFLFSLSFLIRYKEITDLTIPNINKPGSRFVKETFDYILAVISFIVLLPILIIVVFLILITMGWPFLYSQHRIGQNGKSFRLYKFRTMNKAKSDISVSASELERISRLGHFLRKTKIDELPELLNIIRGDMSFVGTRPDVPGYADKLKGDDRIILDLKPGLTGPASLKYVNEEELLSKVENPIKYNDEVIFPDKVRINKAYMKDWSFWLDIKIIIYTILRKSLKDEFLE